MMNSDLWPDSIKTLRRSFVRAGVRMRESKRLELSDDDLAALINELLWELCLSHGGGRLWIPRVHRLKLAIRDEQIRAAFLGNNYDDLAMAAGCTPRRVRQIVGGG